MGAPDLWSEPKVFGPRAEFRFVSLSPVFLKSFLGFYMFGISIATFGIPIFIFCISMSTLIFLFGFSISKFGISISIFGPRAEFQLVF